jgi:hypothetical protein
MQTYDITNTLVRKVAKAGEGRGVAMADVSFRYAYHDARWRWTVVAKIRNPLTSVVVKEVAGFGTEIEEAADNCVAAIQAYRQ